MDRYQELIDWLEIESTTGREERFLRALEGTFEELGMSIERQKVESGRWNIYATFDAAPKLLFCTHVDTVPPFFGPTVRDGKVFSRGACDTKGGLFSMIETVRGMGAEQRAQTGFLLVVGEEVDHIGAIVAARREYPELDMIVLCEPTRNHLARGQKGIYNMKLRTSGVAGHSAFPDVGDSAIHRMVHVLDRVMSHSWPSSDELGPTTVNVGRFEGGVAANVFAPSAEASLLFRTVTPRAELESHLLGVVGGDAEIELVAANDPVQLRHWPGFATDVVPFNTDAPYLDERAPVVLVGPGDIRVAHSKDEHIAFSDIEEGIRLYQKLADGILGGTLR